MANPSERKPRERHSGPPCPHYPHRYKTEAAHQAKLASKRRHHHRQMKTSLTYRLRALLRTVKQRCNDPRHASYRWYGGKGVKNFLTMNHLRIMWKRDGASKMTKPSLDRFDADKDYTFENTCFRELKENQQRGWEKKRERTKAIRDGMEMAYLARQLPQPRQERA